MRVPANTLRLEPVDGSYPPDAPEFIGGTACADCRDTVPPSATRCLVCFAKYIIMSPTFSTHSWQHVSAEVVRWEKMSWDATPADRVMQLAYAELKMEGRKPWDG